MEHAGMETHGGDVAALLTLVRDLQLKTVVEVGTWTGATACRLADEGCSVTCIDWFKGTEDPADVIGHGRTFDVMYGHFRKNCGDRLWRSIFPIVAETTGAPWVQGPFDLAFIDADHRYENCLADIVRWMPTIRRGGLLTGHDYCDTFPGVKKAVHQMFGDDFEVHAHSLWVKRL